MTLGRQIMTLAISVACAAAVALLAPQLNDAVQPSEGVLLGLMVLLAAGLLHEFSARAARQDRTVEQLLTMARSCASLRDEVGKLRDRLDGVGAALAITQPGNLREADENPFARAMADGPVHRAQGAELTGGRSEAEVITILRDALSEDRVDLYLQPIVTLPQRKRLAYECFSRLRGPEGFSLLPNQFIALAEREGLVTALDRNLLERCAELVRKVLRDGEDFDFFCNISRQTLAQEGFLRGLAKILTTNRAPAKNLVLELSQSDLKALAGPALQSLRQLTQLGCRLSMDQVSDLDINAAALSECGVRFVKLEAALVLDRLKPGTGLICALETEGVQVIVEKVEDEAALKEVLDYGISLGQGYLFSKPRLARPAA
jgi:cyclic-di-GMP phosphodiesterase TipF (flagellum assembly factor)